MELEVAARKVIDEDGADVLILGSTSMHQSASWLAPGLEVPLLNPGLVAFKQCEMQLDLGLAHSNRRYAGPVTLSNRIGCQGCHERFSWISVFAVMSSLRMAAVMASVGAFPWVRRCL